MMGRISCWLGMHEWEELTVIIDPKADEVVPATPDVLHRVYGIPGPPPVMGLRCSRCKHVSWHP